MRFILFFSLLMITVSGLAQKKLIIKGDLNVLAVGNGMSCGMQSAISDFKQVKLIINYKDTLYTLLSNSGKFEFPAIRKSDIFEIRFTYTSNNEYLIKPNAFFFSIFRQNGSRN
jgi:hypothetical protein